MCWCQVHQQGSERVLVRLLQKTKEHSSFGWGAQGQEAETSGELNLCPAGRRPLLAAALQAGRHLIQQGLLLQRGPPGGMQGGLAPGVRSLETGGRSNPLLLDESGCSRGTTHRPVETV